MTKDEGMTKLGATFCAFDVAEAKSFRFGHVERSRDISDLNC